MPITLQIEESGDQKYILDEIKSKQESTSFVPRNTPLTTDVMNIYAKYRRHGSTSASQRDEQAFYLLPMMKK